MKLNTQACLLSLLVLCSGVIACQRKIVVEREMNTPPVLQSQPTEQVGQESASDSQELPPGHPSVGANSANSASITVTPGEIKKVQGGMTIQELFAQKTTLAGKAIRVRGKVVKYNGGILGKNWLHIKDGTGVDGTNDLTITTKQEAMLNQVIIVSGSVQFNKDIGSGYVFPAIIEDAKLSAEK